MRVWLQDDSRKTKYAGQTVTIDNFKLITQSPQAGELTFYDKTTGDPSLGAGWATKNDRAIWINQDGKSEYKKLSKDSSGNYFIKLGSDYTDNPNATVTFYSCESTVTSNPQNSFVAKWTTTLQTAVDADSQTFTAYGYKDSSNNGYGTWGEVQKILLSSEDASTLPMTQVDGKYLAVDMYVKGSSTPIAMTFEPNENASLSGWVAYLPNPNSDAAHSITFKFTYKGKDYSISAPNRNSSVNYVITSQNTGYWAPPAIVSVYSTCKDEKDNNASMGTVSVTGGMDGATRVKVTEGTTVTLNAKPTDSNKYRFIGWYSDPEFKAPVTLSNGAYQAMIHQPSISFMRNSKDSIRLRQKLFRTELLQTAQVVLLRFQAAKRAHTLSVRTLRGRIHQSQPHQKRAMTSRVGILTRIAQNWKVRILRFQLRIFRQIICIMPNL